jgi:hypothetical protein
VGLPWVPSPPPAEGLLATHEEKPTGEKQDTAGFGHLARNKAPLVERATVPACQVLCKKSPSARHVLPGKYGEWIIGMESAQDCWASLGALVFYGRACRIGERDIDIIA